MTVPKEPAAMTTAVSGLRRSLRGAVHLPGEPGYDRERATWGGKLDQRPAIVAEAASAADVSAALVFAREHGLPFAVQSTGHGTHVACDGGLLLKTGRLRGVFVDPDRRVARVGAGVTMGEVVAAAAPLGLAPIAGSAMSVGVAGFTLGGGVGWLSRAYGFAADSVLAAEVVTAGGRRLRVDARRHPDLFWALRGGGGNFAVVTALELRLHPVSAVLAGSVTFAPERAAAILGAYRDGADARPDALSLNVVLTRDEVVVKLVHAGDTEDAVRALAPLLRAGGMPRHRELRRCHFADVSLGGTAPSHFELLSELPVDALVEAAAVADAVEIRQWGGAMSCAGGGPVGHRHVPWSATIDGPQAAAERLRPHATGGSFLNFQHDTARTHLAYTGADLARLRAVKQAWDPDNVLGRTHNIAPHAAARAAA
jgi:FAD/FMN-containing dehydrogenase